MKRLLAILAVLIVAACESPPTSTEPVRQLADLVLDTDSIVFVQSGVHLDSSLFVVTPQGDTTYNPDGVTFDLPAGFTRDGDRIRAAREAAGLLVARLNPSDSAHVRAVHHLDSLAPWHIRQSCFHSGFGQDRPGDGTDSLFRIDSVFTSATADSVRYVDVPPLLVAVGFGSLRNVVHWEDGVVDTVRSGSARGANTLTATQSGIDTITLSNSVVVPAVGESPRRYSRADSVCSGYDSTGVYVLEQQ